MPTLTRGRILGITAAGVVGLAAVASGQDDGRVTLAHLIAEIRALRADVATASGTGVRAQVLVGRLQLQEQRIAGVGRQLADAQGEMQAVERSRAEAAARLRVLQNRQDRAEAGDREGLDREAEAMSRSVERADARLQTLHALEESLSSLLDEEQARWSQYNAQLDELERALPRDR